MSRLLPGSSVVSRFIGGSGQPLQDSLTWDTGLGALNHILGPTDQNLEIHAPASRSLVLEANAALVATMDGTTVSLADQITWDSALGALTHILGPSDQNLLIDAPASRQVDIGANGTSSLLQVTGTFIDNAIDDTRFGAVNGSRMTLKTATTSHTANSGTGTETISGIIPAGAVVHAVVARVTTALAGAGLTTWQLGDSGDTDRYGAALATAVDTTVDHTDWTADPEGTWSSAARDLTMTADAGQFDSGVLRVVVFYTDTIAPAS